jgi:hypothetical protein
LLAIPTGRYCCYPGRWTHLPPSPAGLLSVSVPPDSDAAAAAATADAAAALGASAASPPPLFERSSSLCSAVEVSRFPLRRFSLLPPPPLLRLLPAFSRPDLPEEKRSRLCVFPCLSRACLGKMIVLYIKMAQKDRFYSPMLLLPPPASSSPCWPDSSGCLCCLLPPLRAYAIPSAHSPRSSCHCRLQKPPLVSTFPMFVPSLSW